MREDYDELVQLNQSGAISDLQFLLAQDELATAYQQPWLLQTAN